MNCVMIGNMSASEIDSCYHTFSAEEMKAAVIRLLELG